VSSTPEIAVLSYHGWEIDPDLLAADVRALRSAGWSDVSLSALESVIGGRGGRDRFFHVTIDDGAEADADCVAALRALSCPATVFVSLDRMTDAARVEHRRLAASGDVAVEDHTLRHDRAFHYRHIVGFHSAGRVLVTSPERLRLAPGDPVCTYGGELSAPTFTPSPEAREICRAAARASAEPAGSTKWAAGIGEQLVASGLGFRRLGRLCIAGEYESRSAFADRVAGYIDEGRARLRQYLGRPPVAFAFPWWEPSDTADRQLRALGYRMTFSGRGLCRQRSPFGVPRLPVTNALGRPIDPNAIAAVSAPAWRWAREVGRRAVFR
jgi:hypothetical protein